MPPPPPPPLSVFTCNQLTAPSNGEVFVSGFTAGSQATYSCNDGYNIVGGATRQCVDQQGWSGAAPICQGNE